MNVHHHTLIYYICHKNTKNMTILITGVSGGIGLEVVKKLCEAHYVIGIARNVTDFAHPNFFFIQGDVRDATTIERCQNYLEEKAWPLDVLINNAGHIIHQSFHSITLEQLQEVYSINVFAPFILIQKMLPYLKKSSKAHIVNITSMGGLNGTQKFTGMSAYSSSKGALSILTECLAEEFKSQSICCNALALGAVQTDMLAKAFPRLKAPFTAEHIAEFISWFAINGHYFFNGKILPVAISTP